MFRRRLQNGSQQFGDFAEFPSDSRLRVTAFNYKKMLDLVLALFQRSRRGNSTALFFKIMIARNLDR
jgi:hypothetical protein